MLSLQKCNDSTVKCVPYQTIWLAFFNRSICPLTEALSPFYVEKHIHGILFKLMKEGKKAHKINVDTRIRFMKLLHEKWVVSFYNYMKNHSGIVLAGWRKSKIKVFNSQQGIESDPFFVNNIKKIILLWKETYY